MKTFYGFGQLAGAAEVPTASPAGQTPTPGQGRTCPDLYLFREVLPVALSVNGSQTERALGPGFLTELHAREVSRERFAHAERVLVQHSTLQTHHNFSVQPPVDRYLSILHFGVITNHAVMHILAYVFR